VQSPSHISDLKVHFDREKPVSSCENIGFCVFHYSCISTIDCMYWLLFLFWKPKLWSVSTFPKSKGMPWIWAKKHFKIGAFCFLVEHSDLNIFFNTYSECTNRMLMKTANSWPFSAYTAVSREVLVSIVRFVSGQCPKINRANVKIHMKMSVTTSTKIFA
jgi:hypothetical protein